MNVYFPAKGYFCKHLFLKNKAIKTVCTWAENYLHSVRPTCECAGIQIILHTTMMRAFTHPDECEQKEGFY